MQEILNELENIKQGLEQQALLKDLEVRRAEWERQNSLFTPLKRKLERGRKALEAGEDYTLIKELRASKNNNILKQGSLREDMTNTRNELQSAEEALSLIEVEYRDKLIEQTKLKTLTQKVKALDEQIKDHQAAIVNVRGELSSSENILRNSEADIERGRGEIERIELNLREAKKFLQLRAIDERLSKGLAAVQKCYALYEEALLKGAGIKENYNAAIKNKQTAQNALNDRMNLMADMSHKFAIAEKNYVRARAAYENSLKGRSLNEWHEICDLNLKKLADLEILYKKFQEEDALRERLKHFQEVRSKIQQETRKLNLRDVEQAGRVSELQTEVEKLERRVNLLRRIEDWDAVRELLQEGVACPLCGSISHPYVSGAVIPDAEELHKNLFDAQKSLANLRAELESRQSQAGKLTDEISNIGRDEFEVNSQISALNSEITIMVSNLGLQMGAGISPFDELDKTRQRIRDNLQLARNAADTAENAQHVLKDAEAELEKIKQSRDELTKYHQEALFNLQNSKSEETRIENEIRTQDEIINSLKRELIAQIIPFGYKNLPDKNSDVIVKDLEERLKLWQDGVLKRDNLERNMTLANNNMADFKKDYDNAKNKCSELSNRLKTLEAERDAMQQQRIILFASKDPDTENNKMSRDVEDLKARSDERRELKIAINKKLDDIMSNLHALETELSTGRDELQKNEINFGKKLLTLGFKNEDDYLSACLNDDERKNLQERLKELTNQDLELNAEQENARAKLLDLHGGFNAKEFAQKIAEISKLAPEELKDDPELLAAYENLKPEIKDLAAKCGLPEPFLETAAPEIEEENNN